MLGILNWWKKSPQAPLALSVLRTLSRDRHTVEMELSSLLVRFKTTLVLRNGTVAVAKPPALEVNLRKGADARFKIPWDKSFEIHLPVAVPHLNLSNGASAFLCKLPEGYAVPVRRRSDRFDTRRFKNLLLEIPDLHALLPIQDLSASGCRVMAETPHELSALQKTNRLQRGFIQLGNRVHIALVGLAPRMIHGRAVGLEFQVDSRESAHSRRLSLLLGTLALRGVLPGLSHNL